MEGQEHARRQLKKKRAKNGEKNDEDDGANETEKFVRMFDKLTKQEWKIKGKKYIMFANKLKSI